MCVGRWVGVCLQGILASETALARGGTLIIISGK